jgi:hypothetical protein
VYSFLLGVCGKGIWFDVSVVSPLETGLKEHAARTQGHAAQTRFNSKVTKFSQACKYQVVEASDFGTRNLSATYIPLHSSLVYCNAFELEKLKQSSLEPETVQLGTHNFKYSSELNLTISSLLIAAFAFFLPFLELRQATI